MMNAGVYCTSPGPDHTSRRMHPMKRTLLFLAPLFLLAGCGDPVSFSAPVGINLKTKASDAKEGVVTSEKGITTETSNPYGAFINDARGKLDGQDPARIEISSLTL